MKKLFAVLFILLLAPGRLRADVQIGDWLGEYVMNHDKFQGTLRIEDSKRDCTAPPWCHLAVSYIDANGARLAARVRSLDQELQHIVFEVAFPGSPQRFDGYLMSADTSGIAGTTDWRGRTFGFYAVKRTPLRGAQRAGVAIGGRRGLVLTQPPVVAGAPPTAEPAASGSRKTITADGSVETTMPDGRRKLTRPGVCGFIMIMPDGTRSQATCAQVQPATPPFPDDVSGRWLDAHNLHLLDIVRSLLQNDSVSVDNYLRTESPQATVYDRIRVRTDLIVKLTEPL